MRWRYAAAVVVALVAGTSACASPSPPPPPQAEEEFSGTPDEFTELWRACVEDNGVDTLDEGAGNFSAGNPAMSFEEVDRILTECRKGLGRAPISELSDEELRRRYEARIEQHHCLVDGGLVSTSSPSYEVYVDEYHRSGQTLLWEPTEDALVQIDGRPVSPSDVCPRSGDTW